MPLKDGRVDFDVAKEKNYYENQNDSYSAFLWLYDASKFKRR